MPVKHARHISLTGPLAAFVDEQVALGVYVSTSDLVRTAIRLLQERDAKHIGADRRSAAVPST